MAEAPIDRGGFCTWLFSGVVVSSSSSFYLPPPPTTVCHKKGIVDANKYSQGPASEEVTGIGAAGAGFFALCASNVVCLRRYVLFLRPPFRAHFALLDAPVIFFFAAQTVRYLRFIKQQK